MKVKACVDFYCRFTSGDLIKVLLKTHFYKVIEVRARKVQWPLTTVCFPIIILDMGIYDSPS